MTASHKNLIKEQNFKNLYDERISTGISNIYIRDSEEILFSYMMGETPSCIFGRECGRYVVIEYNGDVYPCDFFVERKWLLGNLLENL